MLKSAIAMRPSKADPREPDDFRTRLSQQIDLRHRRREHRVEGSGIEMNEKICQGGRRSCREVGGNWLRRRRFRSARSRRNPRHEGSYVSLAGTAIMLRRQRMVRSVGGGGARAGARVHRGPAGGGAGSRARPGALPAGRGLEWSPPRAPAASAGHHLRPADAVGAPGSSARRGGRAGVEERALAGVPAAQPPGRGVDRRGLSRRHEHAPRAPGAGQAVRGSHRQGRGQPLRWLPGRPWWPSGARRAENPRGLAGLAGA